VGHGEKTDRRREGFSNISDSIFTQDKAEEPSIDKPLTGSKQGPKKCDLKREPSQVHDRIGDESDCSNWQMGKLDRPPWVQLRIY